MDSVLNSHLTLRLAQDVHPTKRSVLASIIDEAGGLLIPRPRRPWIISALILLLSFQIATPACAWGRLGNRVISKLAERHLSPSAKAAITELLLPGESLADCSTWADEVRGRMRQSAPWHYVDVPLDVSGRSKPASEGRLKTSHFEETQIRRLGFRASPLPQEPSHGESAQDGHQRDHSYTAPSRLVPAPASPTNSGSTARPSPVTFGRLTHRQNQPMRPPARPGTTARENQPKRPPAPETPQGRPFEPGQASAERLKRDRTAGPKEAIPEGKRKPVDVGYFEQKVEPVRLEIVDETPNRRGWF